MSTPASSKSTVHASAEDDHFLLWAAVFAQQLEEVAAHGRGTHVDEQLVVKVLAGVFVLREFLFGYRFARLDVRWLGGEHLGLGEHLGVDGGLALDDLAGREVAVFLCL